jgi:hypothetical protein
MTTGQAFELGLATLLDGLARAIGSSAATQSFTAAMTSAVVSTDSA